MPTSDLSTYTLELRAIWQGPSSQPGGYFLDKACSIAQVFVPDRPAASPPTVSQVECQPASGLKFFNSPTQGEVSL